MPGMTPLSTRLSRVAVFIALAGAPAACRSDPILCPQELLSSIIVEVRDSATGAPAARGATGTARVGDLALRMDLPEPREELLLYSESGPPGIYAVLVQKPG